MIEFTEEETKNAYDTWRFANATRDHCINKPIEEEAHHDHCPCNICHPKISWFKIEFAPVKINDEYVWHWKVNGKTSNKFYATIQECLEAAVNSLKNH